MAGGHNLGIDILVEPWMYQYLSRVLGTSPWNMTLRGYEGKLLLANMGSKQSRYKKLQVWDRRSDLLTYRVEVPWSILHSYGKYTLSEEGVNYFLIYYQNRFKDELILWVESRQSLRQVKKGKGTIYIKDAILDFCKKYGINEDHVPFETLKKRVYRHFAEKKKPVVVVV